MENTNIEKFKWGTLSEQKLIKNAKITKIEDFFWKHEFCRKTVLPDMSFFIGQKLLKNAKIQKYKCDISNIESSHFWRENSN